MPSKRALALLLNDACSLDCLLLVEANGDAVAGRFAETCLNISMEVALIDHRQVTFDPAKAEGVTLVQDQYLGLALVGQASGSMILASLSGASLYEAIFLRPDEGPGPRFYLPNCILRLDPAAAADPRKDAPLGSLIVAERGISIMVKPPRGGPSPLCLVGAPVSNSYEGICITRWRVESDPKLGDPEVLYSAPPAPEASSDSSDS